MGYENLRNNHDIRINLKNKKMGDYLRSKTISFFYFLNVCVTC